MDIKIDRQFIADCFRDFVNVPSPVSYYDEILPLVEEYAAKFGYPVTYDRKNTPYITLEGEDNSKTVMVGAHMDTLGPVSYTHLRCFRCSGLCANCPETAAVLPGR